MTPRCSLDEVIWRPGENSPPTCMCTRRWPSWAPPSGARSSRQQPAAHSSRPHPTQRSLLLADWALGLVTEPLRRTGHGAHGCAEGSDRGAPRQGGISGAASHVVIRIRMYQAYMCSYYLLFVPLYVLLWCRAYMCCTCACTVHEGAPSQRACRRRARHGRARPLTRKASSTLAPWHTGALTPSRLPEP